MAVAARDSLHDKHASVINAVKSTQTGIAAQMLLPHTCVPESKASKFNSLTDSVHSVCHPFTSNCSSWAKRFKGIALRGDKQSEFRFFRRSRRRLHLGQIRPHRLGLFSAAAA
jgi:hypothetical protein